MATVRPVLVDSAVLESLAHPVRLDLLRYLMSDGPATASVCARAVGDRPSNCSYHLRVLAGHGLVSPEESADGRERPWRATITGFSIDDADPAGPQAKGTAALLAAAMQLDQRLSREYLADRGRVAQSWRDADVFASYALRVSPDELRTLARQLDDLIRPFIAATRDDEPPEAETVHLGVQAFPRPR
ncbi:MAG: helix-turn-helix domain-containing protein [Actinomycetota bacterium]|nr:helix-turn-helix domain-containing protein [Actinomycetota bacterium]